MYRQARQGQCVGLAFTKAHHAVCPRVLAGDLIADLEELSLEVFAVVRGQRLHFLHELAEGLARLVTEVVLACSGDGHLLHSVASTMGGSAQVNANPNWQTYASAAGVLVSFKQPAGIVLRLASDMA